MEIATDAKTVKKNLAEFFSELNGTKQNVENEKNSKNGHKFDAKGLSQEQKVGILKLKGVGEFIKSILEGTNATHGKIVVFAHHKNVIVSIYFNF